MITASPPRPARLRPMDLAALAGVGLRTRKLRAALSALGIAIGVAAIVAVLGLARSSQARLLAEISALGTNLLTVTSGQTLTGATAELPVAAPGMIARLPGVTTVQDVGSLSGINAYRSPYIPPINTNALSVDAATLGLPGALGTSLAQGSYLNTATAREPAAVLGAAAAQRLGIDRIWPGERIWVGGLWFYVTGILRPAGLAPEIDSAILVGFPAAAKYLHFDGHPSEIYLRTANSQVTAVDRLLGSQANIMVISVLERRTEIGLRRALGATRGQIRVQFLADAIVLALAGGTAGVIIGAAATAVYARAKGWAIVIPPEAWAGGLGAALLIGTLAGLLPAIRAARLSPTEALWAI